MSFFDTLKEKLPFLNRKNGEDSFDFDLGTSDQENGDVSNSQNKQDIVSDPLAGQNNNSFDQTPNMQNQIGITNSSPTPLLAPAAQDSSIQPSPTQTPATMADQQSMMQAPAYPSPHEIFQQTIGNVTNQQPTNQLSSNELSVIMAKLEAIEAYLKSIDNRLSTIEMLLRQRMNSPYY